MNRKSSFKNPLLRLGIYVFVLLLIAAGVFSSVEFYKEEVLNIEPEPEFEQKGTIYLSSGYIDTLNPYMSKSVDNYYLSMLMYDSLFDYDDNLGYVPTLVESFEVNTDRAYIDLELKDGIEFANGSKFTGYDVQFSINALKSAGSNSLYYDKVSKIVQCNVNSNSKVRIYFNNNYNCSLDDLVFPIVSRAGYSNYYTFTKSLDNFKPNGTGQYKFKSSDYDTYLRLVPNEDYFGEKAKVKLKVNIVPDKAEIENLATIDDITCYFKKGNNRKTTANDHNFDIYDFPENQLEFLIFNTERGVTRDKKNRQAILTGIDVSKILDSAYIGDGIMTDTIYYPNFMGVEDSKTYYSFKPIETLDYFKTQGYDDLNGDGYLQDSTGKRLTLELIVNEKKGMRVSAAKIIKKNLSEAGIDVNINSVSKDEFERRLYTKNFDIAIAGYKMQATMDFRDFFDGKNQWGYSNYVLSEKVRELDRLHTIEDYQNCYVEVKNMLLDELPYFPLCYRYMSLMGSSKFEVGSNPTFYNPYNHLESWTWSKELIKKESQDEGEDNQEDESSENE